MLNPQQLGILAQLVYDALVKYPNKLTPEEVAELVKARSMDPIEFEAWEIYLMAEVARIPEMPLYQDLEVEVDMLVEYFDFNIRFEQGRLTCSEVCTKCGKSEDCRCVTPEPISIMDD